ncbi:MAG: UvrD-helicase domain-containing protein [Candidatus Acetothermia bacterium]|jgi:DNA helicase-2/ATP-dependent DNA helicase PcrA|nr:UvrD-helicase domain-containing protein [Candidatus Acetothermia bacterium]MDH7505561.1 UvrD-helicase domain-containing protein [Candidatus Acetothermia bacterium]
MESLHDLNPDQLEAVTHGEGPLLIIAGAGSGKTRVITERMAYLIRHYRVPPQQILGVTFTNKAAEEMRERVERLLGERQTPWIRTFHSTCARILRDCAQLVGYERNFTIIDEQDQRELLASSLKELGVEHLSPASVASFIERAKDELWDPEEFLRRYAERLDDFLLKTIYNAYKRYQEALVRSNSLDFADLIGLTVRLFQENHAVLHEYRERFRFILIDEYQDINYAQYLFARLIAERYENICVVGDDDQAIYSWRGADPSWLLRFEEDFPRAKVVRLRFNYRSPGRVLRAAQALIRNNEIRKEKELLTVKGEGLPLHLYAARDGTDEAEYIAAEIDRLHHSEGLDWGEIAVLYRVNTLSRALEETFVRWRIPYEVVRGLRFYERAEVKDLIAYLRLVLNPGDELSLFRVLNRPRRGLGEGAIAAIKGYAQQKGLPIWDGLKGVVAEGLLGPARTARLREFVELLEGLRAEELGPSELATAVLERTGYLRFLEEERGAEERLGNIRELVAQLRAFEAQGGLEEFLEWLALASEADGYSGEEGRVALMTLHAAKGLEFEAVFITGLEEGLLPHARALDDGDLEEERRLLYVGMTRAKARLYLCYAVQRSLCGMLMENPPSRFLAELPAEDLAGAIGASQGDFLLGSESSPYPLKNRRISLY